MTRTLHARPHLEHFKKQAKKLQAERGPGCRLSEAQLLVARSAGFDSWPKLARHVEVLRALEGTWTFVGLEVDGAPVPAALSAASRILMDGDRFRMESPEATTTASSRSTSKRRRTPSTSHSSKARRPAARRSASSNSTRIA